jgi:lipoate-protein ligase A
LVKVCSPSQIAAAGKYIEPFSSKKCTKPKSHFSCLKLVIDGLIFFVKRKFHLRIFDTGINSAQENMSIDTQLLAELHPDGNPILHFYRWDGRAATYGYFLKPDKYLNLHRAEMDSLSLARRPTGGGVVFHIWDLAFSFLMPAFHPACSLKPLDNYYFVNEAVLQSIKDILRAPRTDCSALPAAISTEIAIEQEWNNSAVTPPGNITSFCMARPTIYDVVYDGRKVAGAAQRRTRNGYLHQGTISLQAPDVNLLQKWLVSKKDVLDAMVACTFVLTESQNNLESLRREIEKRLADNLAAKL